MKRGFLLLNNKNFVIFCFIFFGRSYFYHDVRCNFIKVGLGMNSCSIVTNQKIDGDFEKSPFQNPPEYFQSSSPVIGFLQGANHLGVHHSLSFLPLNGFLNSRCLFSNDSFSFAASSNSPFSRALN